MRVMLVVGLVVACAVPGLAQTKSGYTGHEQAADAGTPAQPYAGLEGRAIAALSDDDTVALRRGDGWGLALAAELNGVPGPVHLLDMRDALGLDPRQVAALEAIRDAMRAEAVVAGERLIAAEAALDRAFRTGVPDEARLHALVGRSAPRGRLCSSSTSPGTCPRPRC